MYIYLMIDLLGQRHVGAFIKRYKKKKEQEDFRTEYQ